MWHHVHTGSNQDRSDGILFLIRRSWCSPDQIGFAEVLAGRIGHLRIHFRQRSLDILGCYQYADDHTSQRQDKRHEF